jgi:hypothetical protein
MGDVSRTIWLRPSEYPWIMILEVRCLPEGESVVDSLNPLPGIRYVEDHPGHIQFDPAPSNPEAHNLWIHLMIPSRRSGRFLKEILQMLDVDPATDGPVMIYPVVPARFGDTSFRAPSNKESFLFDVMPVVSLSDTMRRKRVLKCLRKINQLAYELGGMCYPVGALRYTHADWRQHFGSHWRELSRLKKIYDPSRILTRSAAIFE